LYADVFVHQENVADDVCGYGNDDDGSVTDSNIDDVRVIVRGRRTWERKHIASKIVNVRRLLWSRPYVTGGGGPSTDQILPPGVDLHLDK